MFIASGEAIFVIRTILLADVYIEGGATPSPRVDDVTEYSYMMHQYVILLNGNYILEVSEST